jgi:hypothetical protein
MALEQVVEAMLEGYRLGEVETGLKVNTNSLWNAPIRYVANCCRIGC